MFENVTGVIARSYLAVVLFCYRNYLTSTINWLKIIALFFFY